MPLEAAHLQGIVPAGVCVALAPVGSLAGAIFPEEQAAIARAIPARQEEFRTGRLCARRALEALGRPAVALAMGPDRAPRWPEGVVGSLSHAGGTCAAAVADARHLRGLGIDLEQERPNAPPALLQVTTPGERAALGQAAEAWALLFFSAKESVFKCLYPQTGRFLDFTDVEVIFDRGAGAFQAHAVEGAWPAPVSGRFLVTEGFVLTAAWMAATEA